MKIPRRKFLHLAAGGAALPAVSRMARAQAYPSRPVRVIVPFAAAGPNDMVARVMGQWLSEHLGHPFVIENRPVSYCLGWPASCSTQEQIADLRIAIAQADRREFATDEELRAVWSKFGL